VSPMGRTSVRPIHISELRIEDAGPGERRGWKTIFRRNVGKRARAADHAAPQAHIEKRYRQTLINSGDLQYAAWYWLGGQWITAIPDTGSFELVAFAADCKSCGKAGVYKPWKSRSYTHGRYRMNHNYGSGTLFTEQASDLFGMGQKAAVNQTFWEVRDADMPLLSDASFNAILGVGPPETAMRELWKGATGAIDAVVLSLNLDVLPLNSTLENAVDMVKTASELSVMPTLVANMNVNAFSICLGSEPGSDGYFIWNEDDGSSSSDWYPSPAHLFSRAQVIGSRTWSLKLENARLESRGVESDSAVPTTIGCRDGCSVLMDSGTSLLAVPYEVLKSLREVFEKLDIACNNIAQLPDLVFELGGVRHSLSADAYVGSLDGSAESQDAFLQTIRAPRNRVKRTCELMIMESVIDADTGPMWILGMPFFRKYYTTFVVGKTLKDRAIFTAHAGHDCRPATSDHGEKLWAARASRPVRRYNTSHFFLPRSSRIVTTQKYMPL